MPAEKSVREQAKGFFGNILKRKPKDFEQGTTSKDTAESQVEELERSLTKDDPLLESNTYNGEEDDVRKNSKNKKREKDNGVITDEDDKENRSAGVQQTDESSGTLLLKNSSGNNRQQVAWSNDVIVCHGDKRDDNTLLPEKIFSDASFKRATHSFFERFEKATSSDKHKKSNKKEKSQKYNRVNGDISSCDSVYKSREAEQGQESEPINKSKLSQERSEETFNGHSISFKAANDDLLASNGTDRTFQADDSDQEFQTLWCASSHTMHTIASEQDCDDTELQTRVERNSSENVKPSNTEKAKEKEKAVTPDEEPVVSAPPKKRRWKGFRFNKKHDEQPTTEDDATQLQESDTNQETSFIEKEVEKDLKSPDEEEQPSTSRLSDEEPSIAPPVPRPRKSQIPNKKDTSRVEDPEEPPRLSRRRRRRKASRRQPELEEANDGEPSATTAGEERHVDEPEDDQVLGVTVHHSDHLRADLKYMSHPVVRVSVVDAATGNYLAKTNSSRRVTSYYENENVTSVLPIMTQPFDFRANQSVLPRWEETLIFNESFNSMIETKNVQLPPTDASDPHAPPIQLNMLAPSPMLFFVVRDFVSMAKANNMRSGKDDMNKGWLTVAWAFLKLVGANGKPNTDRKVRLQLFHPPRNQATTSPDATGQSEPAFFWWRDHVRQTYQSTLYVTLKAVNRPEAMNPASRSMSATQPECGIQTFKQLHQTLEFADGSKRANLDQDTPKWTRIPGQTCKVPNIVALRLWSGSDGAFTMRFSNNGRRLALGCKHGTGYPVLLYGIPNGEEMGVLIGHQQLVYDIQWSNDDQKVVTSSGDGTAQVWDLNDKSKATHTLPHPAYVYTGVFHPTAQYIVVTGGYDSVIRVWSIATSTAQMLQELDAHKAFVNSMAFDHTGLTLYSVDSGGLIVAWNCHSHEKPRKNNKTMWSLKNKFVEKELTGVCINSVQVHPGNNKLLLHCRDSVIRIFDVRIHSLLNCTGSISHRQFMRSALTPCGSFIFSGSEDGCAYVWNAESGDQVVIYNELGFSRPVRDVTYHPHDHLVAFCCFSPNMPVLLFKYDKDATSLTGGIISVVGSSSQKTTKDEAESQPGTGAPYTGSKVDRVKRQLDAVLGTPMSSPRRPMSPPGGEYISPQRPERYGPNNTLSTWGSTFDSTTQSMVQPSFMSPHASPEARVLAQHFAAGQPKSDTHAGWRPTFTAVGGSPYRSDLSGGPDVTLSVDDAGNRSLRVTSVPGAKVHHKVVALYGYHANRSDELTLMRNDVIKVLYMDGPTWWFGERMSDGRQGYFPTNYVAVQEGEAVEADESLDVLFGALQDRPESAQSEPPKTVHALKMGSKVHFYSQSESEDDDLGKRAGRANSSRQRRREKRDGETPEPPIPVVKTRNVSFTSPVVKKPAQQRTSKRDESSTGRKLPTLLPSNERMDQTITETTAAVVEASPEPRKRQRKSPGVTKRDAMTSRQQHDETREDTSYPIKETTSESDLPDAATSRQHFGVLKAVQAKMAEQPSFSDSVVVGPEFSGRPGPSRLAALGPAMTSTASKPKKSRARSNRSSSRGRKPKLQVTSPSEDDVMPMIVLDNGSPDVGLANPAYDDVSEL